MFILAEVRYRNHNDVEIIRMPLVTDTKTEDQNMKVETSIYLKFLACPWNSPPLWAKSQFCETHAGIFPCIIHQNPCLKELRLTSAGAKSKKTMATSYASYSSETKLNAPVLLKQTMILLRLDSQFQVSNVTLMAFVIGDTSVVESGIIDLTWGNQVTPIQQDGT